MHADDYMLASAGSGLSQQSNSASGFLARPATDLRRSLT